MSQQLAYWTSGIFNPLNIFPSASLVVFQRDKSDALYFASLDDNAIIDTFSPIRKTQVLSIFPSNLRLLRAVGDLAPFAYSMTSTNQVLLESKAAFEDFLIGL